MRSASLVWQADIDFGKRREFAMAAGEMSREEFTAFLGTAFGHLARRSADGAIRDL